MTSSALQIYRDMFSMELATIHRISGIETVELLTEAWREAKESQRWSSSELSARLVWAGIGLLVFGRLEHLEEILSVIRDNPDVIREKNCRYCVAALQKILPLPPTVSPLTEPQQAIDWIRANHGRLEWDEDRGAIAIMGNEH